jgi:hypothetical protein
MPPCPALTCAAPVPRCQADAHFYQDVNDRVAGIKRMRAAGGLVRKEQAEQQAATSAAVLQPPQDQVGS